MPKIYKHSKIAKRILYKLRHHKGHGIHSPFIFSMVNDVIEEKRPYYCYTDLQDFIQEETENKHRVNKVNKLVFRLANFFDVKTIVELGSGISLNTLFLVAHSQQAHCFSFENNQVDQLFGQEILKKKGTNVTFLNALDEFTKIQSVDCLSINLKLLTQSQKEFIIANKNNINVRSYILVQNIRQNKKNYKIWKSLTEIEDRTAILDLFNIGIILFNPNLYRWSYQISF